MEINCKLNITEKDYNGTKYNVYKLYIGGVWVIVKPNDNTSKEILEDELKKIK